MSMNDAFDNLVEMCIKHSHRLQKYESAIFQAGFAAGREYQKSVQEGKGHITGRPVRKDLQETLGVFLYQGFHVDEESDDFVHLFHGNEKIASFNQTQVTTHQLHQTCQEHLKGKGE